MTTNEIKSLSAEFGQLRDALTKESDITGAKKYLATLQAQLPDYCEDDTPEQKMLYAQMFVLRFWLDGGKRGLEAYIRMRDEYKAGIFDPDSDWFMDAEADAFAYADKRAED